MAFGQKVGTLKSLKKTLKKGTGTYIKYVPADGSMTIRFLTEPEEFVGYYEHFDELSRRSYPCIGEDTCPGCRTDERRSFVFLANAVNTDDDRVIPMQLKRSVVNSLVIKYEKYGTLLDRDYEIVRSGKGLDTTYDVTPEAPSKKKLDKYTLLDLEKVLEDSYNDAMGGSDDDDEEVATRPSKAKAARASKSKPAKAAKKTAKKAQPEPEPEVEDLASLGELADGDDEDAQTRLTELAEEAGIDPDDYATWFEVAEALVNADEDEDEDEDEDADEDADDSDEVGDDEDEATWTLEELQAKSIGELKAIAKDYDLATKGLNKAAIVKLIHDAE